MLATASLNATVLGKRERERDGDGAASDAKRRYKIGLQLAEMRLLCALDESIASATNGHVLFLVHADRLLVSPCDETSSLACVSWVPSLDHGTQRMHVPRNLAWACYTVLPAYTGPGCHGSEDAVRLFEPTAWIGRRTADVPLAPMATIETRLGAPGVLVMGHTFDDARREIQFVARWARPRNNALVMRRLAPTVVDVSFDRTTQHIVVVCDRDTRPVASQALVLVDAMTGAMPPGGEVALPEGLTVRLDGDDKPDIRYDYGKSVLMVSVHDDMDDHGAFEGTLDEDGVDVQFEDGAWVTGIPSDRIVRRAGSKRVTAPRRSPTCRLWYTLRIPVLPGPEFGPCDGDSLELVK